MAVKRYDGSAWQVVAGKGDQGTSSSIATWVKTASGGETSLSGNDDNSQPLSYTVGQELVFINGALQKRGVDYTATTGTSITGLTALVANDVVTVWTVNAFSVTGAIANTLVDAKGDLIVATGADTPGILSVGSNDQVLTADSSTGTGLKWAAPTSGSMTQLATGSFSGTNLQLSGISTAYKDLRLVIQDWYVNTDNSLFIQLNNVTGTDYQNIFFRTGTSTITTDLANAVGYIGVGQQDASDTNSFAMLTIFDYANTNTHKLCQGVAYSYTGSGAHQVGFSMSAMTSGTSAVTEIDVFASGSPTMTQGTYFLYGVK